MNITYTMLLTQISDYTIQIIHKIKIATYKNVIYIIRKSQRYQPQHVIYVPCT